MGAIGEPVRRLEGVPLPIRAPIFEPPAKEPEAEPGLLPAPEFPVREPVPVKAPARRPRP